MIVRGAFTIKQQAVLARLQCQRAVGAEEELVAMFRVRIGLLAVWFGALGWSAISCKRCEATSATTF